MTRHPVSASTLPSWAPSPDLRRLAARRGSGSPDRRAGDFDWILDPHFPLHRLEGEDPTLLSSWRHVQDAHCSRGGDALPAVPTAEGDLSDAVVLHLDEGIGQVWDGHRRIRDAASMGRSTVTAIVGVRRPPVKDAPTGSWRPNSLPDDIEYCLEHEQLFGAIGADQRAFVDLFDDGVAAWFGALAEDGAHLFVPTLKIRHDAWRADADPASVMAVDWCGLNGLRWLLADCAGDVVETAIRGLGNGLPAGADPRELVAASMEGSEGLGRFRRSFHDVLTRAAGSVERWGEAAFLAERDTLEKLYRERSAARMSERTAMAWADGSRRVPATSHPDPKLRKRRRRVLSKSAAFLENLVGRQRARAWISGDDVVVSGRRFDFRVRVAALDSVNHGALDVHVTDKDGVELAALCVYAPQTPALDQISSLVLHVVSGEEDEIVRSANIIRSTLACAGNEAFLELRREKSRDFPGIDLPLIPEPPQASLRLLLAPFAEAAMIDWTRDRLSRGALSSFADLLLPTPSLPLAASVQAPAPGR